MKVIGAAAAWEKLGAAGGGAQEGGLLRTRRVLSDEGADHRSNTPGRKIRTNDDQTEMIPQLPIGDTQPMPMPLQFATVAPAGAHGARHARTRPTRMVEPSTVSTASRWGARTLLGFTLVTAALIGSGIGLALPTPGAPRLD